MNQPTYKKKLIEVAIPLEAINREAAREKSIRHGHPSTLHLWWARRPLAACRAVLFASIVDDPSSHPDKFPSEAAQEMERKRLFRIIEELVKWENSNNEKVLKMARDEIMKSTNGNPPPVLDPFCGGGSIPLEAQRLGLEAHGSDLNPVAVLITKALIEIPPKFAGKPPVNPDYRKARKKESVSGAQGLAADVAHYGAWMRSEAEKRIGKYYPKIKLPKEAGGEEASVIAWIWARTVKCPNPACGCEMPLVRSFALSTKAGKESWVEPIIKAGKPPKIEFVVKTGKGKAPDGVVNRKGATCVACKSPVPFDHVRLEGKAGRMGQRLIAIVAEGTRGRVYLSAESSHITLAESAKPAWKPDHQLPHNPRDFKTPNYGMRNFSDLFTNRQLVALTTFSDLVGEAREQVKKHAIESGLKDDGVSLENGGTGATAYADAVSVYLAFAVGRLSDVSSSICSWNITRDGLRATFARQAIPMTWDFAEVNPMSESSGNFLGGIEWIQKVIARSVTTTRGIVEQVSATLVKTTSPVIISTDPPYYDNIGYADLSDYFYIWLRKSLLKSFPNLMSTVLVPKSEELIASPYRFSGNRDAAKEFFEDGFTSTFKNSISIIDKEYPITIYYAFKQSENSEESDSDENDRGKVEQAISSTGWETLLSAILTAGFCVVGTWPLRTERASRTVAKDTNALASSIGIVCRPRDRHAVIVTLSEFKKNLRKELMPAIKELLRCNLAPVDLPQSAIGPGIGVFSRYKSVIDANGEPVSVKSALVEINRVLSEFLDESGNTFDSDTLWAIEWFKINGFESGKYGDAELLARAKNTSIDGLASGGIVSAKGGKVQLLARSELPKDWNPKTDNRTSVWEITQHLVRILESEGELATAKLLADLGSAGEDAKSLAYRLFAIAESKGWSEEARSYNALITSWSEIESLTAA
jgi:putative DNA methylase